MRKRHQLRKNKANQRPVRHLFVDIESRLVPLEDGKTEHRLWFGWACFWRRRVDRLKDTLEYTLFHGVDEFWDLVLHYRKAKEPLYLIAHNVAYDFGVMNIFDNLEERDFTLSSFYTSGMTSIIKFTSKKGVIYVLDNGNYFTGTLAKWGEAIGFPKDQVDPLTAAYEDALPYCKRDVEILQRLWRNLYAFLGDNDLGNWGRTLPSQAFSAFRHRFMSHRIIIHAESRALELERAGYHGGRTSIFFKGKLTDGPYYKLDVNSMYPHVMAEHRYPNVHMNIKIPSSLRELETKLKHYAVMADVTINAPDPIYPVKQRQHIIYPVGHFRTVLTTPELAYGLTKGHIEYIHTLSYYRQEYLFRDYVSFFYALKLQYAQEPDNPYYAFAKLYLNSLYGKFGQKKHTWERIDADTNGLADTDYYVNLKTGQRGIVYRFGSTLWTCQEAGEAYNSFPAIAAHVTAYARMYLWELRELAGRENFYYTDTDSCIVNSQGLANLHHLLDKTKLGMLKIEGVAREVELLAPKVYKFGDSVKRKGVPRKAQLIAPNTWEFDKFPGLKIQGRKERGKAYYTQRTTRKLSYRIHDGHETESGWIAPLRGHELQENVKMDPKRKGQVQKLGVRIENLRASLPLEWSVVFQLWDFRKGGFRQQRNRQKMFVAIEYSPWDGKATELGFADLEGLKKGVLQTLDMHKEINALKREKYNLTHNYADLPEQEEIPF